MRLYFLLMIFCFLPAASQAVQEDRLSELLQSEILPALYNGFQFGSFTGAQGRVLSYAKYQAVTPEGLTSGAGEPGALVVLGGRTEYISKYAELLYDLRACNYSIYIYDHRGQGGSGRDLPDPHKGYVEKFDYYVADFSLFLETIVGSHQQIMVLAHSMGGTIASAYVIAHPGRIKGLVLCAPMLEINTAPFPKTLARWLSDGISALGGGTGYVFGGGPYNAGQQFQGNELTQSRPRFQMNKDLVAAQPEVALGAPTFQWLAEAFAGMAKVRAEAAQLADPVLLLSGADDRVVGRAAQEEFCREAAACRFVSVAGAKHELLMESDIHRDRVLEAIISFLPGLDD